MKKERLQMLLEGVGAGNVLVCEEGLANMNIFRETAPVADGGFDPLEEEDRSDRTLRLLHQQVVSEGKELDLVKQDCASDPREQILALYDEFRPRLFRYIRSLNLGRDQAEEVIQEVFMQLTTELLRENDIENIQGWIVRVAHNLTMDALKKNERDRFHDPVKVFAIQNRVDPSSGPEEAYLEKEKIRRMEIALSRFNLQQRQCFYMRVQGFRYKDIGLALAISEQRAALVVKQVAVRLAAICG